MKNTPNLTFYELINELREEFYEGEFFIVAKEYDLKFKSNEFLEYINNPFSKFSKSTYHESIWDWSDNRIFQLIDNKPKLIYTIESTYESKEKSRLEKVQDFMAFEQGDDE